MRTHGILEITLTSLVPEKTVKVGLAEPLLDLARSFY